MKVKLPAVFNKITSLADRSYKLEFITRELGSDAATLMGLIHQEGWLLMSLDNDLSEADIPDEKADSMTGQKTPSKRLRDRLFVYYDKVKKGDRKNFEIWYTAELERIGEKYLEKLDE